MIDQVMRSDHTQYNATVDLIERNLAAERGGKAVYVDDAGSTTYAQLAERVDRAANALRGLGIKREQRLAIVKVDCSDWAALPSGRSRSESRPWRDDQRHCGDGG
jgi:acyl-coenzyme A synthetase/AMP-(fatty) acid ligase